MRVVDDRHDSTRRRERVDERGVGVLDELTLELRDRRVEARVRSHRVEHRQLFLLGDLAVHLAEGRSEVDDPRPFVDGDEVGDHDPVGAGIDGEVVERPVVSEAGEIGHGDRLDDLDVLAEHVGDARRGEDEVASTVGCRHAHVLDLGPDCGGDVRDERPRRGRPNEKVEVGADDREPDVDRGLSHVLIGARLAQLVARQRGAAASAVRHDLEAFVDEVAVPHLAEQPPDALDVLVVEGPVRVRGVDPHPDASRQRRPVLDVALHRLAAPLVERLDPEVLDLVLVRDAERLLHLDLDRQPVAVPSALARDVPPAHRVKARVQVLERASPHVMDARPRVRGRRTFVEHPLRRAFTPPEALAKGVLFAPALEHACFELDEVERGRYGRERHVP